MREYEGKSRNGKMGETKIKRNGKKAKMMRWWQQVRKDTRGRARMEGGIKSEKNERKRERKERWEKNNWKQMARNRR